jgi:hypothetical protein
MEEMERKKKGVSEEDGEGEKADDQEKCDVFKM